jgi:dienelactone hydrolase
VSAKTARRLRWRIVAALATVGVFLVVALWWSPALAVSSSRPSLISISETREASDPDDVDRVQLRASDDLAVELLVRRGSADSASRLPLAVVLGGHRTGADAIRFIGETPGVIVAALAYPYDGDHRPRALEFVRDIPRIRAAIHNTPHAVRLALDYLSRRADVDTTQIEAIGVSLGAPFMIIAAARDDRIDRVWAIHGSGGIYAPIEASLRRTIGFAPVRAIASGLATIIIGPSMAPERWVSRISPRPLIMVNARDDERLPRAAVERLHAAAREPRELHWVGGTHVRPDSAAVRELVATVMDRIAER